MGQAINQFPPAERGTWWHLRKGRMPHAGAMSYALERRFTDPVTTIYGPGINAGSFGVFGGPPLVANFALTQAGLGGIVAGQYALQPLVVPPGSSGAI